MNTICYAIPTYVPGTGLGIVCSLPHQVLLGASSGSYYSFHYTNEETEGRMRVGHVTCQKSAN